MDTILNCSFEEWHCKSPQKLLCKLDLHILPIIVMMYLLNYLERSNLSQARLGGLETDLGLPGNQFNIATSILFIGYLLIQIPSNVLLVRTRPSIYLGMCMALWGVVSGLQAATSRFSGILACRGFLGFVEAPFFPGIMMLLSSWYTRNMNHACGIAGWRWLFTIEGSVTVIISLLATIILPDFPNSTKWLNEEERAYGVWCLSADIGEVDDNYSMDVKEAAILALKDYKVYLFGLMLHSNTLTQTFSYFFPTIVKTLGYSSTITLLLTVPCVRFFAMFLMPIGAFPGGQIILAWVANSMPRPAAKRSIALALCNVFSNSSNIYGAYLYPSSDGPRYIKGGIVISCMAVVCMLCALVLRYCLIRENRKLAIAEEQWHVKLR
ncbi:major facilitator superfamily domain-containing protein [Lipomyces starkeyi]